MVRICGWPMTVVLPAAEVLDFEFWISNLFGISILGFRISDLVVAAGRVRISNLGFRISGLDCGRGAASRGWRRSTSGVTG